LHLYFVNKIWDKVYSKDSAFFGEEPSSFSQICYSDFKKHQVKKLLELGCGQGRDTIFFALHDLDVYAIDSSKVAIEVIKQKIDKENISIKLKQFDAVKVFHLVTDILVQFIHICFIICVSRTRNLSFYLKNLVGC
jgi:tRNA G46 methylase TrmB